MKKIVILIILGLALVYLHEQFQERDIVTFQTEDVSDTIQKCCVDTI